MKNLVKKIRADYESAKSNKTLTYPNVAYISDENAVEFHEKDDEVSIWIMVCDNYPHYYRFSAQDWSSMDSQEKSAYRMIGIYIEGRGMKAIFNEYNNSQDGWGPSELVSGVTAVSNNVEIFADMKGKDNSDALIDSAVGVCYSNRNRRLENYPNASPYIASSGELQVIFDNKDRIDACISAINDPSFSGFSFSANSYVWSSTQSSSDATRAVAYVYNNNRGKYTTDFRLKNSTYCYGVLLYTVLGDFSWSN